MPLHAAQPAPDAAVRHLHLVVRGLVAHLDAAAADDGGGDDAEESHC